MSKTFGNFKRKKAQIYEWTKKRQRSGHEILINTTAAKQIAQGSIKYAFKSQK